VRISVSEWSVLRLAVKLPRALVNPQRFFPDLREHARTRRGMAAIGIGLVALLIVLHVKTASPEVQRLRDLVAHLVAVKAIDARWDAAMALARSRMPVQVGSAVQNTDAPRIQRALQAAEAAARTTALRTTLAELRKAYVEKADVVARFEKASIDTRAAVAAVTRADSGVATLVRQAWRDFPQRERLVAAENLAVRVIIEAQQYYQIPAAAHRASLESYMVDLQRALSLPKSVQAGLAQLGNDVHQLLLLKPLEHMLGERLSALDTARRIDEVTDLYQRELAGALAAREWWRVALGIHTAALVALVIYLGVTAIGRYRDLELLYLGQTRAFAKALHRLKTYEQAGGISEARARDPAPAEQDAEVVSERRRRAS
jgi:hypothetical protein